MNKEIIYCLHNSKMLAAYGGGGRVQHHSDWKNQQWVIIAILLNTASTASGRKEPASELQQLALTNFSAF